MFRRGDDKKKDKKSGKKTTRNSQIDLGVEAPVAAQTGTFFRTTSFHPAEFDQGEGSSHQLTLWREAFENPLTHEWTVFQLTRRPNVKTIGTQNDEFVIHREPVKEATNVTLDKALENLLQYESTQTAMGYTPAGDTPDQYEDTHVHQFALNEGRAPDINGNVHPCKDGMVMAAGTFSESVIDGVKVAFNTPAEPQKPVTLVEKLDLNLFNEDAQIEDISRFITKATTRNQWTSAVKSMAEVANMFARLQLDGQPVFASFHNELTKDGRVRITNENLYADHNVKTAFPKTDVQWETISEWTKHKRAAPRPWVHNEFFFAVSVRQAREALTKLDTAEDTGLKDLFERYLDTMELAVEIACSKFMVTVLENIPQEVFPKKMIDDQIAYTTSLYKDLGASDEDLKSLNAEIIAPFKRFFLQERFAGRDLEFYAKEYGLDLGAENEETGRGPMLYYPEAVFDFLDQCKEIGQKFDQEIEAERSRITHKKDDLSSEFTESSDGNETNDSEASATDNKDAPEVDVTEPTNTQPAKTPRP